MARHHRVLAVPLALATADLLSDLARQRPRQRHRGHRAPRRVHRSGLADQALRRGSAAGRRPREAGPRRPTGTFAVAQLHVGGDHRAGRLVDRRRGRRQCMGPPRREHRRQHSESRPALLPRRPRSAQRLAGARSRSPTDTPGRTRRLPGDLDAGLHEFVRGPGDPRRRLR
ncbi:Uncharacterised protein [Mycobacteroides abscessus subsp. abscessus]|nr:Uncharacterised protein [Mycobacteroides abscessus subsp. abscessus]